MYGAVMWRLFHMRLGYDTGDFFFLYLFHTQNGWQDKETVIYVRLVLQAYFLWETESVQWNRYGTGGLSRDEHSNYR
jgi:hypothetical protein